MCTCLLVNTVNLKQFPKIYDTTELCGCTLNALQNVINSTKIIYKLFIELVPSTTLSLACMFILQSQIGLHLFLLCLILCEMGYGYKVRSQPKRS